MLPLLPFLVGIVPALIGGVICYAIAGFLDKKKIKEMQKKGSLSSVIKCTMKNKKTVSFESLENGEKYNIKCDGVSDDISEGEKFIYA